MEGLQRSFSISSSETANVVRKWREFLCELYYPIEAYEIDNSKFSGRLDEIRLDFLQVTTFDADHQRVERTKFHTKFDSSEEFVFVIPRKGTTHWGQFGQDVCLLPFSSTMILSSQPYWAACSNGFANLTIRIPSHLLRSRVSNLEALCGKAHRRSTILNRTIWNMVSGFFAPGAPTPEPNAPLARRLADTIVDLVAFALACERDGLEPFGGGQRDLIRTRVVEYLRSHSGDPMLSPQSVAAANGISVSYMNKLLRSSGQSMSRRLLDERLAQCRERLSQTSLRHLSIGRIAFDAGFSNQAHFSSCFRAKYGLTPREVRRAALAPASANGSSRD